MTDLPTDPRDPVEGSVPTVIPAGPLERRASGQGLALNAGGRSAARPSRFAVTPGKLNEALLYRWKSSLAVGLIFACIGAGIAWVTYKPKYTAVTSIRFNFGKQGVLPGPLSDDERSVGKQQKNETQIIKSRELLKAVVQKNAEVRSLETIRRQEDPVSWLEKELQAYFLLGTDFFRIGLTGENPQDVAKIVNVIREVYKNQYVNAAKQQQANQLERINKVVAESEEKIRAQYNALRQDADRLTTGDAQVLNLRQRMALEEFGDRRRELSAIEMEMRRNAALIVVQERELAEIKKEGAEKKLPAELVDESLEKHLLVQKEQFEIGRLEDQIKEYSKSVIGTSSRLVTLNDELKTARDKLLKVKAEVFPEVAKKLQNYLRIQRVRDLAQTIEKQAIADKQRVELKKIVDGLHEDAKKIGIGSFDIEVKRNTIDQQQAILKTYRAEKERLEIELSNQRDMIVGEQEAEVPTINQASLLQTGSLYSLGGLLLGLLGVSYLEARLHRVHRSAQVDQELGIHILGVLPLLAKNSSRRYGDAALGSETIPDVMFLDAVNSLCARLLCDDRLSHNSVLMVTSATEDEGKTMLATQLAAGLARMGRRTLLLDCDFRNSRCHEHFGIPDGPGLGNVLCGEAELADVIHTIPDSDARFLTAGQSNSQVIKALNNGKFSSLLTRLRQDFDFIIVDSAPTPVVSDGLLIGKLSDGVILVVRPKVSKAAEVVAAFEQLAALRIPILGSVVNATQATASGSYYK